MEASKTPRRRSELSLLLEMARQAEATELQLLYIRSLWGRISRLSRSLKEAQRRLRDPAAENGEAGKYARALQTCTQNTIKLDQLRRQVYQAARMGRHFDMEPTDRSSPAIQVIWAQMPPPGEPDHEDR
jgi:hypothetical protein